MFNKTAIAAAFALAMVLFTPPAQAHDEATTKVLNNHLQAFGAGDMTAMMSDYTEDSVIVLPNGVLRGKEQIRGLFTALFAEFGQAGVVFNLKNKTVAGHVAYIVWDADTPNNTYKFATDTYVVRGGKISYQTVAFNVTPK